MPFKPIHAVGVALAAVAIVYLALSDGARAMRYFNYGVKSYKDEKFDLAARQFQKAAELSPNATSAYNLALSRWAAAVEGVEEAEGAEDGQEDSNRPVPGVALAEKTKAAHTAITDALGNYELEEDQEANLIYCDGVMLALEGKTDEARVRLREAVEKRDDHEAALVELVKLETGEPSNPSQLLLIALAEVEKPEIIADLTLFRRSSSPASMPETEIDQVGP